MNTLPTIKIKGKEYVMVKDRVIDFHETYKNGSIQTQLLSEPESPVIVIKAVVIPDVEKPGRIFTGHASERVGDSMINKTSALENAESSAIGRAMASLGIGVVDSFASADEVHHAITQQEEEDTDPDWIKGDTGTSTPSRGCKFCGTQGVYHKKGCPNATA